MAKKYNLGNVGIYPIGGIIPFAGQNAPTGYLMCNGQEVSRTEYSYLFDIIGTTYGEGDGSTTFNVPDLRDKFPQGASGTNTLGTVKEAGLPNITGKFSSATNFYRDKTVNGTGAFSGSLGGKADGDSNGNGGVMATYISMDASASNPIYGNSDTVQPPAVCMNYIIRAL